MHLSKFCSTYPMRKNKGSYQEFRLKFCPQGKGFHLFIQNYFSIYLIVLPLQNSHLDAVAYNTENCYSVLAIDISFTLCVLIYQFPHTSLYPCCEGLAIFTCSYLQITKRFCIFVLKAHFLCSRLLSPLLQVGEGRDRRELDQKFPHSI